MDYKILITSRISPSLPGTACRLWSWRRHRRLTALSDEDDMRYGYKLEV